MIDPTDITKYDRTDAELEELLLFCVAVAGKTAKVIAKKVEEFLELERGDGSPFEKIRRMAKVHSLEMNMQHVRLGKYSTLAPCFKLLAISGIDLKTCTCEKLESFPGIGPKTSRFFILHTRPNQRIAVLDTHVLQYLGRLGHDVPKTTPTGRKYAALEKVFIEHADSLGRDIAELDLEIWNENSTRSGKLQEKINAQ